MFRKPLVCLTEVTPSEVVDGAARLCARDGEVILLHVVRRVSELSRKEAEKNFSWAVEKFRKAGFKKVRLELVESSDPKVAIVNFACENGCDVLITGIVPPRGLLGRLSSTTDYILKKSPCTVVLIRKPT
ncbi:MAG: universal stress protein [Candidatus Hadarchaeales archaeon]